jgi:hypothetical protein
MKECGRFHANDSKLDYLESNPKFSGSDAAGGEVSEAEIKAVME